MVFYFLKQMSRWTICTQSADVMPQYSNLTYSHFFYCNHYYYYYHYCLDIWKSWKFNDYTRFIHAFIYNFIYALRIALLHMAELLIITSALQVGVILCNILRILLFNKLLNACHAFLINQIRIRRVGIT